jgi:hypothetical protein
MHYATADTQDHGLGLDYQDTISLLQEEIARLEAEVGQRDEALAEQPAMPAQPAPAADPDLASQVTNPNAELAERDETIEFLLDQVRLFEEAEAAGRAEWEQLNQWVTQVEQRVAQRDQNDSQLAILLEAECHKGDAARLAAETNRRTLESQRQAIEEEVTRLRAQLGSVARNSGGDSDEAFAALEGENQRLRETCGHLRRGAAEAGELEIVRAELAAARGYVIEVKAKGSLLEDGVERERKEHQAELASLRTQIAHLSLRSEAQAGNEASARCSEPSAHTEIDERIRAFRLHLREVHEQEQEERTRRRFSSRLSRLWNRTGPNP